MKLLLSFLISFITLIYTKKSIASDPQQKAIIQQQFFNQLLILIQEENPQFPKNLQFDTCNKCLTTFNLFSQDTLKKIKYKLRVFAEYLCDQIIDSDVCYGIMQDFFDSFVNNFFYRYLTSNHICVFIKACKDPRTPVDFEAWKNKILSTKPTNKNEDKQNNLNKNYHILHLSDMHLDLEYTENSLADCKEFFCCRPESGSYPHDDKKKAKYWGSIAKCDIPLRTAEALLLDAKQKADIKAIIWTGDSISHDVWHQTVKNQTLPQNEITNLIQNIYPNIPIFPIFGNHELYPCGQYDVSLKNDTTQWIKHESAQMWKQWLDDEAYNSLFNNGYYTQFNKELNLRILALNTQACDNLNFFLIQNNTDPNNQVEFMYQTLLKSEQLGQKVVIMGHIPPGDNTCSSDWAMRYQVLIDRFEHVVIGQLFGHTHNDHIESVVSSTGEKRAVGSVFIAPSGTTYSFQNPSYRIFEFEGLKINNYFQYRLNLEKANQRTDVRPSWDLAYDFKSEYNITDINNDSIYEFAFDKLVNDEKNLQKYISHYFTGSESLIPKKITQGDKRNFLCMAQNIVFNERFKCFGVYTIEYPMEILYMFLQGLQGKWFTWNNQR